MLPALRFGTPSPKTEVLGREKTSMSVRLPACFVVCLAPVENIPRLFAGALCHAGAVYELRFVKKVFIGVALHVFWAPALMGVGLVAMVLGAVFVNSF